MTVCIFADIHGNAEALERMLEAEGSAADRYIFAGDVFGYFYRQEDILDRLMALPQLTAVKGNHEKYFLSGKEKEKLIDRYGSSYELSLSETHLKYIEALPESAELVIEDKKIGIFHGGPENLLEQRIYPDSDYFGSYEGKVYDYMILAHTHYRFYQKYGDMTVINPGSLGQPRDGKGFSYCLLDIQKGSCEFKAVQVDMGDLLRQVKEKDAGRYVCDYLERKYRRTSG